jgi:hypothetical protein
MPLRGDRYAEQRYGVIPDEHLIQLPNQISMAVIWVRLIGHCRGSGGQTTGLSLYAFKMQNGEKFVDVIHREIAGVQEPHSATAASGRKEGLKSRSTFEGSKNESP